MELDESLCSLLDGGFGIRTVNVEDVYLILP